MKKVAIILSVSNFILLLSFGFYLFYPKNEEIVEEPSVYNAEGIYELVEESIFYLRILREDNSVMAVGTGVVLLRNGIAATAYHVIDGAERMEAIFNDGRIVNEIEIVATDPLKDMAILRLSAQELTFTEGYEEIAIREEAVKHGEEIFAIGYPLKDTSIITKGIINSPAAEINGRKRILTSAQIASGMSGGPVLDQSGELIGIISGSLRNMNNIHLVIDTEDLRSVLPDE